MAVTSYEELLNDKEVIQEIERFKWIESEKAGRDIGFDIAAQEWLEKFSGEWVKACRKPAKSAAVKAKTYLRK